MKYKLLENRCVATLNSTVNDCLSKGWELYGNPSCSISMGQYSATELFSQALILKGDPEEKKLKSADKETN